MGNGRSTARYQQARGEDDALPMAAIGAGAVDPVEAEGCVDHVPLLGSRRCVALLMCWLANIVCYVDRVNISVAIITMSKELQWSDSQQGFVLSSFFYGYILTQIFGGK